MNFSELQTEVLTHVIDTPTAIQQLVPTFVNRATRKIAQKHNFRFMEASTTLTTLVGQHLLVGATPSSSDFKDFRSRPQLVRQYGAARDLAYASRREAIAMYRDDATSGKGEPRLVVVNTDITMEVWPYPDSYSDWPGGEYRIDIDYWQYPAKLVAASDSNWLTDNAEQWIVYQAVSDAFFTNEDEMHGESWLKRANREFKDVVLADKSSIVSQIDVLPYSTGVQSPHTQE